MQYCSANTTGRCSTVKCLERGNLLLPFEPTADNQYSAALAVPWTQPHDTSTYRNPSSCRTSITTTASTTDSSATIVGITTLQIQECIAYWHLSIAQDCLPLLCCSTSRSVLPFCMMCASSTIGYGMHQTVPNFIWRPLKRCVLRYTRRAQY